MATPMIRAVMQGSVIRNYHLIQSVVILPMVEEIDISVWSFETEEEAETFSNGFLTELIFPYKEGFTIDELYDFVAESDEFAEYSDEKTNLITDILDVLTDDQIAQISDRLEEVMGSNELVMAKIGLNLPDVGLQPVNPKPGLVM